MEYRKLGTTDIKVSLICLGTMNMGVQVGEEDGRAQLDYALEQGINFIDAAEMYPVPPQKETYGRTEEIIATWLKKSGRRKDIVLATKICGPSPSFPWVRDGKARVERAQIFEAVDGSLKRLGTDTIDLYQIHWPQRPVNNFRKLDYDQTEVSGREADNIAETLQALDELITSGKVRHIGLSNETPWGVMTFLNCHIAKDLPRVQTVQNPYNLLNRTFDIGLAEIALQEEVGLLAYSPLGGGTLTGKYLNGQVPKGTRRDIDPRSSRYARPRADEAVADYLAIAKKHGLEPAQMALAFVNARPYLTSTIIGATSMEQLKVDIDSVKVKLPQEIINEINAVHDRTPNPCP